MHNECDAKGRITAHLITGVAMCYWLSVKRAGHAGSSCYRHSVQFRQADGLETLEPSLDCFSLFFIAAIKYFALKNLWNLGIHYTTLFLLILAISPLMAR